MAKGRGHRQLALRARFDGTADAVGAKSTAAKSTIDPNGNYPDTDRRVLNCRPSLKFLSLGAHVRIAKLLIVALLSVAWAWPLPLRAEQGPCANDGILIEGNRPEDVAGACDAIKDALPVFLIAGLATPRNLVIRLVDEAASTLLDEHEIGHYDGRLHAIVIRDYRAATRQGVRADHGLGAIATRGEWQSYIVHELAHAAIHASCDQTCPSRAIHEYVAAVAQISALPEPQRARLLDAHRDLGAFEHEREITEIYYSLHPRYFAVKAYKNYLRQTDPAAFLKALLDRR